MLKKCMGVSCRSIKDFSDQIHKRDEMVDVLVNNAGVFLVEHNRTQEGFEVVQGTNYFGTFLLTHLLLDKMKETAQKKGHARHVHPHIFCPNHSLKLQVDCADATIGQCAPVGFSCQPALGIS